MPILHPIPSVSAVTHFILYTHEDFVQYLGRRAIRRASQLYYRANPVDNIRRLRTFFRDVSTVAPFMRGLYGAPQYIFLHVAVVIGRVIRFGVEGSLRIG